MELKLAKTFILSVFCSLALMGGATAQSQEEAPVAGRAMLGITVAESELVAKGWRASKLIRADVYNDANQKIGKIDDYVVTPDGRLSVAIVDVGGFLGLGKHRVAIPVEKFGQVAPKITLSGATKESLKALPEFRYAQ
jgi:sporulation protein YlmC with PRC-barrel domain